MKIRMTVTIDIIDPAIYNIDSAGGAIGHPIGELDRLDVGTYVCDAVSSWGGQDAPGSPMFPTNIRSVRVQGTGFDFTERKHGDAS